MRIEKETKQRKIPNLHQEIFHKNWKTTQWKWKWQENQDNRLMTFVNGNVRTCGRQFQITPWNHLLQHGSDRIGEDRLQPLKCDGYTMPVHMFTDFNKELILILTLQNCIVSCLKCRRILASMSIVYRVCESMFLSQFGFLENWGHKYVSLMIQKSPS